ncbi:MAG TPA: DUF5667 domain-containing protein [Patescibacteria group bacterium]
MYKLLIFLPLLILLTFPQLLYAQTPSPTVSPTPISVDYTLPYPGLLPNNPLYILKVVRDKIVSFFITNPSKRASFDLLQADKRLEAAYQLQKEGSKYDDLVISTLSKGENYFDDSIIQIKSATSMGDDTAGQILTMHTASLKHMQVITQMMQNTSPQMKKNLEDQLERVNNFEKVLSNISQK